MGLGFDLRLDVDWGMATVDETSRMVVQQDMKDKLPPDWAMFTVLWRSKEPLEHNPWRLLVEDLGGGPRLFPYDVDAKACARDNESPECETCVALVEMKVTKVVNQDKADQPLPKTW